METESYHSLGDSIMDSLGHNLLWALISSLQISPNETARKVVKTSKISLAKLPSFNEVTGLGVDGSERLRYKMIYNQPKMNVSLDES